MAHHRAIFEVTCDTGGSGEDDVRLKLPSSLIRHARIEAVTVDDSEASGTPSVTVREVDVDDDGDETPGETLYFSEAGDWSQPHFPRVATVDADDVAIASSDGGMILVRRKTMRVEIENGASGDVYTVNVYYETSGDYRF